MPFGIAVICLILVAQALRPGIVSIGPLLTDIIDDFGLAHTQASLLTAIPTLLMGLLALPTPWLAQRFGRDRVIVVALFVLAAATLARAYAGSTLVLFATTAGVGAGIAIAGALVPGFVKAGFPRQVALLMGLYAMALSMGSTFAAGSTGFLAQVFGTWRLPAGLWTIPPLLGVAAWAYVASRDFATRRRETGPQHPLPLGNRTAWLIAAYFAFNNVVFYSFISWLAPLYVEMGHTAASAGLILACFTFAFLVATPLFGALSRNEDRRPFLALAAGIGAMGVLWMAIAPIPA
ncbi:MFS transporter, partial [Roseovarius sp. HI0049]